MSPEKLEHLLGLFGQLIQKQDTNLRKAIPAAKLLMLIMRFLAPGDSLVSLSYLFREEKK